MGETKPCRYWGQRGRHTGAVSPLLPMVTGQAEPLQPLEINSGEESHLQPGRTPHCIRGLILKKTNVLRQPKLEWSITGRITAHVRNPYLLENSPEDSLVGEMPHCYRGGLQGVFSHWKEWQEQHGMKWDWLQPPFPIHLHCYWGESSRAVSRKKGRVGRKVHLRLGCAPTLIQFVTWWWFCLHETDFVSPSWACVLFVTTTGEWAFPVLCLNPQAFCCIVSSPLHRRSVGGSKRMPCALLLAGCAQTTTVTKI